jgi:phospholipid/cholesterol/gamma-HCH transport system ATP-binding protein
MLIQIDGLKKSFGDHAVLRDLSLTIPPGSISAIVGGSGAGKSVLMKHIVGLMKPDSGRILIDDQDIVPMKEKDLIPVRGRIGMIFQTSGLLQSLTVGENVGLILQELHHKPKKEIRDIVAEKLKLVGLEGREDQMPSTLSGGQLKRAAIARALTVETDCFIFDEPTAGLDPMMSDNIDEVIREVNKETGATTVVVTHDLISVFSLAQEIHFLHEGKMAFSGSVSEFAKSEEPHVVEFLERERQAGRVVDEAAG